MIKFNSYLNENAKTSSNPSAEEAYERAIKEGQRIPEVEEIIKTDPVLATKYAFNILHRRWLEAEPYILKNPSYAAKYAFHVMHKQRWPEAEEVIKQFPPCIYWYATNVLGKRWPEAEETLKKIPAYCWMYARDVMKQRWHEAEDVMLKIPSVWNLYITHFSKGEIKDCFNKSVKELIKENPVKSVCIDLTPEEIQYYSDIHGYETYRKHKRQYLLDRMLKGKV